MKWRVLFGTQAIFFSYAANMRYKAIEHARNRNSLKGDQDGSEKEKTETAASPT